MYKHVWAEIDLNALEYNLKEILKIVSLYDPEVIWEFYD